MLNTPVAVFGMESMGPGMAQSLMRVGLPDHGFDQRRGLLESDVENSDLVYEQQEEDVMGQLYSHSVTYRIAVGPHQARKIFTL